MNNVKKISYISSHLLSTNETIIKEFEKSSTFLVFQWIKAILFFWLLLIPVFKAISESIFFASTEYALTNKKVICKVGLIATSSNESPLDKIENLKTEYTFWGKIFNYGNLVIATANRSNLYFNNIKNVEEVKKTINNAIENYK